jgi:hypothetical protein
MIMPIYEWDRAITSTEARKILGLSKNDPLPVMPFCSIPNKRIKYRKSTVLQKLADIEKACVAGTPIVEMTQKEQQQQHNWLLTSLSRTRDKALAEINLACRKKSG